MPSLLPGNTRAGGLTRKALLAPMSPGFTTFLADCGLLPRPEWTPAGTFNLKEARSILVVTLANVGDTVLTIPFIRELRRNCPDARIELVVQPPAAALMNSCPYVDGLHPLAVPRVRGIGPWARYFNAISLGRKLRRSLRPDLAILPRWDVDHAHATHLCYFSGAPSRVGYSELVNDSKQRWNSGYDRLMTHVLDDRGVRHEVDRGLELIRWMGGEVRADYLELWNGAKDEAVAEGLLHEARLHGRPLAIFHPGAVDPKRRWPADRFVMIGRYLARGLGLGIVVVGGQSDRPLAAGIAGRLGEMVLNAAGRTTLPQTAALIKRSRLYVGSDSGPMHLAAALGVPVAEISCHAKSGLPQSANAPERFGPWGVSAQVLRPEEFRRPCTVECVSSWPHCILDVEGTAVKNAVLSLLEK